MVVLSEAPQRTAVGPRTADQRAPCSAVIARQFAIWPFAPRTLRVLMLVDPNQPGVDQRGLLRAMQYCSIGSETGSQTTIVRAATRAAHHVLRHHNHDVLPLAQVTAAAAVAAVRGNVAYVALVGEAAVFAWRNGRLNGRRTPSRVTRPLGMDLEPAVTLWSTPLRPGDRLVLACGGSWHANTDKSMRDVLGNSPSEALEERLADVLGGARVLVDDGSSAARPALPARTATGPRPTPHSRAGPRAGWRRWLAPLVPLALLAAGAVATLSPPAQPQHLALRVQAESLLAQARNVNDLDQAHTLATRALSAAQRAAALAPAEHSVMVTDIARALDQIDRVYPVQVSFVVRLGPTGSNVVDLAVADDRLFTLDVVENAVRRFGTLGGEQWPTPETLVVRKGAPVGGRFLDTPVAIQYLAGPQAGNGVLTVVDRARTIAQLMPDGVLSPRSLPSSSAWQRIGALGGDQEGNLFVLDSGARRLLEYPGASQRLIDPPSPLLEARADVERIAEVVPLRDIFVRLEDGSVHRLTRDGQELSFDVRPPDGPVGTLAAIAADRLGGLFLADPARARILQIAPDGGFVRQLRDPALAGVHQIQSSPDGRRLYALVATGVLGLDIPTFADTPAV
jgi:hypothetical protein